MTKKYEVKTASVINRNPVGSIIELPKEEAERFEAMRYVEIIGEVKPEPKAKKSSDKKPVAKDAHKAEK